MFWTYQIAYISNFISKFLGIVGRLIPMNDFDIKTWLRIGFIGKTKIDGNWQKGLGYVCLTHFGYVGVIREDVIDDDKIIRSQ